MPSQLRTTRRQLLLLGSVLLTLAACSSGSSSSTPEVRQLAASTAAEAVPVGLDTQASASAIYSDASLRDVTGEVTWSSSDPAVLTVDAQGKVHGVAVGKAKVKAALAALSSELEVQVTAAVIVGLDPIPDLALPKGTRHDVAVIGQFSDQSRQDVTAQVTWSSSAPEVVAVDAGCPHGRAVGPAIVTVAIASLQARFNVNVTPAVLSAIAVDPAVLVVPTGLQRQLAVTGIYSDATTADVTAQAAWVSSDAGVATVSAGGLLATAAPGHATVTATVAAFTATADVTVHAAVLTGLEIQAGAVGMPKGTVQPLVARGHYDNGADADLTASVLWSTSAAGVVAVSNAAGHQGEARAAGIGTATITATAPCGCLTATVDLTVTPAVIAALVIAPPSLTLPAGLSEQLVAQATFTDGTTGPVTGTVTWASSAPAVATVSNVAGKAGLLAALTPGAADVSAVDPVTGVSALAKLTVSDAALLSIAVTPASSAVPLGLTAALRATGTYTDAHTYDLTATVTWTSSAPDVASISNGATSHGVAAALAVGGPVTLTATDPVTLLQGTAQLTVTDAALMDLVITPPGWSMPKGLTKAFTVRGTYSDHSSLDLTTQVAWTSSDPSIAQISPAGVASSTALSHTGAVTIAAWMASPIAPNGVRATARLEITAAVLTKLTIAPRWATVPRWLPDPFTATGTYSDLTTADVTESVTWSALDDPPIATVGNAAGQKGVATGVAVGDAHVLARDPATTIASNTYVLHVTPAVLTDVIVSPALALVPRGLTRQFEAGGVYCQLLPPMCRTYDLTEVVTWSTHDWPSATVTPVAAVSNVAGTRGRVQTLGLGTTTVRAEEPSTGKVGSGDLVVTPALIASLTLVPDEATVPLGVSQAFKAMATYTDGTIVDVTADAMWASNRLDVASVLHGVATTGQPGQTTGTATISAGALGLGGWHDDSAKLTVVDPVLLSIAVTPAAPEVARGQLQAFHAMGHFTNGDFDVTTRVVWDSSAPAVATVSNAAGHQGVATGLAEGAATITAIDAASGVHGQALLTVNPLALVRLDVVVPPPGYAIVGGTLALEARATWSDDSTSDLTASVDWSSADPSVLTVAAGVVMGVADGTARVTAIDPGSGVFGTAELDVFDAPTP